jgi:hypothetical protein
MQQNQERTLRMSEDQKVDHGARQVELLSEILEELRAIRDAIEPIATDYETNRRLRQGMAQIDRDFLSR